MATKKTTPEESATGAKYGKNPKPPNSATPRVALVGLSAQFSLNTKKKHKNSDSKDVRSYVALKVAGANLFADVLHRNKITQGASTSGSTWDWQAAEVRDSGKTLIVMAKFNNRVRATLPTPPFADDSLTLDVTVTNSTGGTVWTGIASLQYVTIDLPPVADFP